MASLLLLEDDIDLGQAVVEQLQSAGHRVHWCKLVEQARAAEGIDLALLDLNLPDGDGLSLLRSWRAAGRRWPVIVLTARDQVSDRVRGLKAGADDYLVKPFDLDELLARVDAVWRRCEPPSVVAGREIVLDLDGRVASRHGRRIDLTAMEWAVLAPLARQAGRIVSRGRIEDALDARRLADAESNSLEVIVSRLRRKLGPATISTHRGLGYRFDG
jgi:two-component system, OmpR family, response regulator